MGYATLKLSDNRRAALDVVAGMGQATCQEIADALDKPKSNVYRTLKDLVTEGFLTREGDNYSLVQESRGCDNLDNFDNRDNSDNFDNRPPADSGYQGYQGYQSSPDNPVITDAHEGSDVPPPGLDPGKRTLKVSASRVQELIDEGYSKADALSLANMEQATPAPTGAPAPGLPEDYCGPAVWHHKDYDELVTVTGFLGAHSGERFFSVEGSATGAPGSELEASRADALAIANAEQATPGPTDAPDGEGLADAIEGVKPLVGMLASGPMRWDTFAGFAVNNHARPDLVEAAALECGAMIYECDGVRWVALA